MALMTVIDILTGEVSVVDDGELDPTPPQPALVDLPQVSMPQMRAALVLTEVITRAEGLAWAAGTIPEAVQTMIDALPAQQAIVAEQRVLSATFVDPTDGIVAGLAAAEGKSEADMIALFQLAASL